MTWSSAPATQYDLASYSQFAKFGYDYLPDHVTSSLAVQKDELKNMNANIGGFPAGFCLFCAFSRLLVDYGCLLFMNGGIGGFLVGDWSVCVL